jgi:hypothetical protein
LGDAAIPALERYAAVDVASGYGSDGVIAAVIEHVGGRPAHGSPTEEARQSLHGMLGVAARLVEE